MISKLITYVNNDKYDNMIEKAVRFFKFLLVIFKNHGIIYIAMSGCGGMADALSSGGSV